MNDRLARLRPIAHNPWRVALGFTFFTHGGQQLFAWSAAAGTSASTHG